MKRPALLGFLGALVIIAAAYGGTLAYPFQFDDFSSIRDNAALRTLSDPGAVWRFRPSRFIVHESFALNMALTGRSTAGLRFVNLLVHLGASLLAGTLARRLAAGSRGASAVGLWTTLLFAAHPLATQAVTYLIQRTASLAAFFELASLVLYLDARRKKRWWLWAASWTLALMAALTKEMAVALPFLVLTIELYLRRRRDSESPHPLCFVPYGLVPALVAWSAGLPSAELGRAVTGFQETASIRHLSYFFTEMTVLPRYLKLFLWPVGQNLDPDVPIQVGLSTPVALGLALLVGLTTAAIRLRRRFPLVLPGWIAFLIASLPESSVFPISDVMVEHRMYLPMVALCLAAASLFAALPGRRLLRIGLPVILIAALSATTLARNRVWSSEIALWSDVCAGSPRKARGHNNLGMALEAENRPDEAEAEYRTSIELEAGYLYGRINLGRFLAIRGRYGEALPLLEEVCREDPDNVPGLNNLGLVRWSLGDTAGAARAFLRAIAANPHARAPADNLRRLRPNP